VRPPSSALTAPRRALLGPADVEDEELAAFAAAGLGVPHATVLTSTAAVFPYDRPAITTAGRYHVRGSARTGTGEVVRDLGQDSAALWLEHLPARRVVWDLRRHARAAYLLGRLAASRAVAPLATAVHGARTPRVYAGAWLTHVVLPALTEDGAWAHSLVRAVFDARLRRRLLAAADALPALLDELDDTPATTAHGDACTANLLAAGDRDALVGLPRLDYEASGPVAPPPPWGRVG